MPEKKLYYFSETLEKVYSVAVGSIGWQTPTGKFHIASKIKSPGWNVPVSIQKEMEANGLPVKTYVPPGKENPLGNWWMSVSGTGIGIHSTNFPSSIGYAVTHGCIRLKPVNAKELFKKVNIRMPVYIIYQPFKLGFTNNEIYLEVFKDIYNRNLDIKSIVLELLKEYQLTENLSSELLLQVIKEKKGFPVLISKKSEIMELPVKTTPVPSPSLIPSIEPSSPAETPSPEPTPIQTISPSLSPEKDITNSTEPVPSVMPERY